MYALEDEPTYLVFYALWDWQPVHFVPHCQRNMIVFLLLYDELCGCIKDRLQRTQMHSSSIKENGVAIVNATGDERVD